MERTLYGLTASEYELFRKYATTFGFVGIFKAFKNACSCLNSLDFNSAFCTGVPCGSSCVECVMENLLRRVCQTEMRKDEAHKDDLRKALKEYRA